MNKNQNFIKGNSSMDDFLNDRMPLLPEELKQAVDEIIKWAYGEYPEQVKKLEKLKNEILERIDSNTETEEDLQILNGWSNGMLKQGSPEIKKYIEIFR